MTMPDEEVHAFVNDLERPMGTYVGPVGLALRVFDVPR